ncbi:MAG: transposase [Anaerolineales bacterium]
MTHYDPGRHHRRSIRLKGYDYSERGAYFITVCIQNREPLLGEIVGEELRLNDAGRMVEEEWLRVASQFPFVETDAYVVMPNHFHGILFIVGENAGANPPFTPNSAKGTHAAGANLVFAPASDGEARGAHKEGDHKKGDHKKGDHKDRPYAARPCGTLPGSLGRVVQAFKSRTTHRYVMGVRYHGWTPFPGRLWQRNYYEHIVRNEADLNRIREYVATNPLRWTLDQLNPANPPPASG